MFSVAIVAALLLWGAVQAEDPPFQITISSLDKYLLGQDVTSRITITNNADQDYKLFTRLTPLEGFKSVMFVVTQNRKTLRYNGLLFKRGPLDKSTNNVLISAKHTMTVETNLSSAYTLDKPAQYSAQLDTILHYMDKHGHIFSQHVTSNEAVFEIVPKQEGHSKQGTFTNQKEAVRKSNSLTPMVAKDPMFDGGGDSVDRDIAKTVWEAAYEIIVQSPAAVDKGDTHYIDWFGSVDKGHQLLVKGLFQDIQKSMEEDQFILYLNGTECERNDFAYSHFGNNIIYLCESYFRAQDTHDFNSKLGTFIHQLTHIVGNTDDHVHADTPEACKDLATDAPMVAIRNAYNYEYFCETL